MTFPIWIPSYMHQKQPPPYMVGSQWSLHRWHRLSQGPFGAMVNCADLQNHVIWEPCDLGMMKSRVQFQMMHIFLHQSGPDFSPKPKLNGTPQSLCRLAWTLHSPCGVHTDMWESVNYCHCGLLYSDNLCYMCNLWPH